MRSSSEAKMINVLVKFSFRASTSIYRVDTFPFAIGTEIFGIFSTGFVFSLTLNYCCARHESSSHTLGQQIPGRLHSTMT